MSKTREQEPVCSKKTPLLWMNDPGVIEYPMTNDYMFRTVLQRSQITLHHLCSSALHIPVDSIRDITIDNAIELGEAITNKTFIMDINVTLNNHDKVNLEMQVVNQHNWQNRSLAYLCRRFDHLQVGEDYNSTAPVTHISFLDFDLFLTHPEFYASNKLMNVKNHLVYNDNFTLNVLSLNRTDLATEEDRYWQLDIWAKLFKTTTWKELQNMIGTIDNPDLQEAVTDAAETLYLSNSDETIRQQCEARREQLFHEQYVAKQLEYAESRIEYAESRIEYAESQMEYVTKQLERLERLEKLEKENADKDEQIAKLQAMIEELQNAVDSKK